METAGSGVRREVRIRNWSDTIGFLFFAAASGFAAFVFLRSVRPLSDSFGSGLGFVLFADVWLAIFVWSAIEALFYRTVVISAEGVRDERRLFGACVRRREVLFAGPHFVNVGDYQGGGFTRRWMSGFRFVGPGGRISVQVTREKGHEIRDVLAESRGVCLVETAVK